MNGPKIDIVLDEDYICLGIGESIEARSQINNILKFSQYPCISFNVFDEIFCRDIAGVDFCSFIYGGNGIEGEERDLNLEICEALQKKVFQFSREACETPDQLEDVSFGIIYTLKNDGYYLASGAEVISANVENLLENRIVKNPENFIKLVRAELIKQKCSEEEFWLLSEDVFPDLFFNPDKNKLRFANLGISTVGLMDKLITGLAFLNDFGSRTYFENEAVYDKIASANGVNLSRESNKTRASEVMMKERDVTICDEILRCEWHIKFEKLIGRLHFHFGNGIPEKIKSKSGERIIIGFFCDHKRIK